MREGELSKDLETAAEKRAADVDMAVYSTPGGSEAGWLPIFRGVVLGCMDSYDSEKRRILQRFSRSTRFAFLCTAPKSDILQNFVKIFVQFSLKFRKFRFFPC